MNINYANSQTEINKNHYDLGLKKYLTSVYQYISCALAVTALISIAVASSQELMYTIHCSSLRWIIIFAPLMISFYLGKKLMFISQTAAQNYLMLFAASIGLSLSSLFTVFTSGSIAKIFFISASTFGVTSVYAHNTKRNLFSSATFLVMGSTGLFIAILINCFLKSAALHFVSSAIGVLIFTTFTAYDTQRIKLLYYQCPQHDSSSNLAIYGALALYMDFINLFIFLLQLLGIRRSD